jgi:hypothetical protein
LSPGKLLTGPAPLAALGLRAGGGVPRCTAGRLFREADASGLAYWRDLMWKRDGGPDNVIAGMPTS